MEYTTQMPQSYKTRTSSFLNLQIFICNHILPNSQKHYKHIQSQSLFYCIASGLYSEPTTNFLLRITIYINRGTCSNLSFSGDHLCSCIAVRWTHLQLGEILRSPYAETEDPPKCHRRNRTCGSFA